MPLPSFGKKRHQFLEESDKILDIFKSRDTAQNVKQLKLELEAFDANS